MVKDEVKKLIGTKRFKTSVFTFLLFNFYFFTVDKLSTSFQHFKKNRKYFF